MRHEESRIQATCVRWFRLQYPRHARLLVSIPNGMQTSASQARIAVAEGLVSGAADLALFIPNEQYHGLFIEMKTAAGRQSAKQKQWQAAVEKAGYKYVICRSLFEFIDVVNEYLNDGKI